MIAIDIGLKRIGVAWRANGIIVPLAAIMRKNRLQAARELDSILRQKNASTLIVGVANDEMRARAEHFINLLEFSGKVDFISEELSSKEAETRIQSAQNRKDSRKNGALDSIAAMIILERYVAKNPHPHQ